MIVGHFQKGKFIAYTKGLKSRMSKSIDEKWEIVKDYYENAYRLPNKNKMKFHVKLKDSEIEFLYDNYVKLRRSLAQFYENQTWLVDRLYHLRGQEIDHVAKRKPND